MSTLKVGSYIVAINRMVDIEERSVGLIKDIQDEVYTIFFIGAGKEIKTDKSKIAPIDLKKTGKPYDKKICNICHILKPMNDFDINQTDAQGVKTTRPSCKDCRVHIDGEPMKLSEKKRLDKIKPKDIFTCPICKKTSIVDITAKFVKDHDHITGNGREWICDSCNTGLGRFKDDIKLLQVAIEYLRKHHAKPFD